MRYRRAFVPGASYFFTLVTEKRRPVLASGEAVGVLRDAFRAVRSTRPFELDAVVVLPDHLHCIWTLPPGDADFSTRWRLIKTWFTKHCDPALRLSPNHGRLVKCVNRPCGSIVIGNICCVMKQISSGMSTTSISIRSSTVWRYRRVNGFFPALADSLRQEYIRRIGERESSISRGWVMNECFCPGVGLRCANPTYAEVA